MVVAIVINWHGLREAAHLSSQFQLYIETFTRTSHKVMEEFVPRDCSLLITLFLFWFPPAPAELTVIGAAQLYCQYVVQ